MKCLCDDLAWDGLVLSEVCVGDLWMFNNLEPGELRALSEQASRRRVAAGEWLFRQGEQMREMFLIKGGRIALNKLFENGSEKTLDIRKGGDLLGEDMLAEETEYPVTARCLEDALVCSLKKEQFESIVLTHPNIGLQVIKNMSKRIALLTHRIGDLATSDIKERLYKVLNGIASEHGKNETGGRRIPFPLTHEELGFLIGAHRVSVSRAMKALKLEAKIEAEGKILIVSTPA